MFPSVTVYDPSDRGGVHAILFRQFMSGDLGLPDLTDNLVCQLRRGDPGTASKFLSALGNHVVEVVLESTDEKVVRIHALWIVALMADDQTWWNKFGIPDKR